MKRHYFLSAPLLLVVLISFSCSISVGTETTDLKVTFESPAVPFASSTESEGSRLITPDANSLTVSLYDDEDNFLGEYTVPLVTAGTMTKKGTLSLPGLEVGASYGLYAAAKDADGVSIFSGSADFTAGDSSASFHLKLAPYDTSTMLTSLNNQTVSGYRSRSAYWTSAATGTHNFSPGNATLNWWIQDQEGSVVTSGQGSGSFEAVVGATYYITYYNPAAAAQTVSYPNVFVP